MSPSRLPDLSLLFVSAVWGMNIVAMKFLLTELSPVNLVMIRFFSGTLLLFLLLLFFEDVRMPLLDFFYLCLLGVTGITAYQLLFVVGMKYTSATNAAILVNTSPIYGAMLSRILGLGKLTRKQIICTLTGFLGVYVLITKGSFRLSGTHVKGDLLVIASSLMWSLYTILSARQLSRHSPLKVTTYAFITGSLVLVPFTPMFLDIQEISRLSIEGWAWVFFTVFIAIVIGFFLWYWGIKQAGPSRGLLFMYAIPVFSVLFAHFLLRESLYVSQVIGSLIVFISIAYARRS
jgi:drug/metabolite transporter (DMT)-like permease